MVLNKYIRISDKVYSYILKNMKARETFNDVLERMLKPKKKAKDVKKWKKNKNQ